MSILRKKVFISYRREDTGPAAGRVYDRLSRILSKFNVFFDVSTIGGGESFETTIVDAIARSDAALIFIGEKWLQPVQPTGKARVWEANDYVRAELRAALARPILVLPYSLAKLRCRNRSNCPRMSKSSRLKTLCRFVTKALMMMRSTSWRPSWVSLQNKDLGKIRAPYGQRSPMRPVGRLLPRPSCLSPRSYTIGYWHVHFQLPFPDLSQR